MTPEVRSEQNHKYYLKRKQAGTVGIKLKSTPGDAFVVEQISPYTQMPYAEDLGAFVVSELTNECTISFVDTRLHERKEENDEQWDAAQMYAKRIAAGFNTTVTTPHNVNVEVVTDVVKFKRDGTDRGRIFAKGALLVDDEYIGEWVRVIHHEHDEEPYMEYSQLAVEKEFQGKQIGTATIKHFDNVTKAAGIKTVKTTANSDIGGYAWAKAGYDWDTSDVYTGQLSCMEDILVMMNRYDDNEVNTHVADGGKAERQTIRAMEARLRGNPQNPDYPTPYEVAMCGKEFATNGMWAGKKILLGAQWYGQRTI